VSIYTPIIAKTILSDMPLYDACVWGA